jgi:hypothetical protein
MKIIRVKYDGNPSVYLIRKSTKQLKADGIKHKVLATLQSYKLRCAVHSGFAPFVSDGSKAYAYKMSVMRVKAKAIPSMYVIRKNAKSLRGMGLKYKVLARLRGDKLRRAVHYTFGPLLYR